MAFILDLHVWVINSPSTAQSSHPMGISFVLLGLAHRLPFGMAFNSSAT
jgi:hypothetical protein